MKLLLTSNTGIAREDYQTISTFDNFRSTADKRISTITDLRIHSFLLGLSCLYWLIDNYREMIKKINFVINLPDQAQTEALRAMIKKYSKEEKKK